jgi:hypothetical protein
VNLLVKTGSQLKGLTDYRLIDTYAGKYRTSVASLEPLTIVASVHGFGASSHNTTSTSGLIFLGPFQPQNDPKGRTWFDLVEEFRRLQGKARIERAPQNEHPAVVHIAELE